MVAKKQDFIPINIHLMAQAIDNSVLWAGILQNPTLMYLAQNTLPNETAAQIDALQKDQSNSPKVKEDAKEEEEQEDEELEEKEEEEKDSDDKSEEEKKEECIQEETEDGEILSDECEPTASGDEEEEEELGEGQGDLIPIGFGSDGDVDDEDFDLELAFGSDEDAVVVVFIDEDVIRDFLLEEGDSIPPELAPLDTQNDSFSTFGNTGLDVVGTGNILPPIILDLDGDGVELIDASVANFSIDVNGDNTPDSLGWAGNDDGVLVYDADESGTISNLDEFVFSRYDAGANTDLEGLRAAFDTNNDGIFDNQDAKFSDFAVWQDSNGNGTVDSGEFLSLGDMGIKSIDLKSDGNTHYEGNNLIFGNGNYTLNNGDTMTFADVGLGLEGGSGNLSTTASRVFTGSVLANDLDNPGTVTVTGVSNVTPGATVLMNPDGTFTYIPPPGVTGITDTFDYTIQNELGQTGTGTVSIDITGMIWYLDNSSTYQEGLIDGPSSSPSGPGTGTSHNPFTSLDVFNDLGRPDLVGDWIYIHGGSGPYDGGLTLQENQTLLGEGTDLIFNGVTLFIGNPNNAPILINTTNDNGGSAVVISGNNTLEGFNIGTTLGPAIGTIPTGDSNFSDLNVNNSPGTGLAVDNIVPGTHTFTNINIQNAGGIGIDIANNPSGTLNFNNVSIDGAVGAGVRIFNNNAAVNIDGLNVSNVISNGLPGAGLLISQNSGPVTFSSPITLTDNAEGLVIENNNSGVFNFNGVSISNASPVGPGIRIVDNNGGNFTFSGITSVDMAKDIGVLMENNNGTTINFQTLDVLNTQGIGQGIIADKNNSDIDFGTTTLTGNSGIGLRILNDTGSTIDFNNTLTLNQEFGTTGIDIMGSSAGTFNFSNVDINDASTHGVHLTNNNATINFNGVLDIGGVSATQGDAFFAMGNTGGNVTISELLANNQTGFGVLLDGNANNFNFQKIDVNSSGKEGVLVNNATGGNTYFSGLNVNGSGSTGLDISNSAKGSLVQFFGTTTVDGAQDVGVNLYNNAGTIDFSSLNVFNTNGAGHGIQSSNNTGTINYVNTTLTNITGVGLAFNDDNSQTTLMGPLLVNDFATTGIDINGNSAGTFTFSDIMIEHTTNDGIHIGNSNANVNLLGTTILGHAGQHGINAEGNVGGKLTINNIVVDGATGDGIHLNNNTNTIDILELLSINNTLNGLYLGNSNGTFNFAKADIESNWQNGIQLTNQLGGTVNFGTGGLLKVDSMQQDGIQILGGNAGTLNFTDLNLNGTAFGDGIELNGIAGTTVNFLGTTNLIGTAGDAVFAKGNNTNINFGTLNIGSSGQDGIDIQGSTGGTLSFSGGVNINGANNRGINVEANSSGNVEMNMVDIKGALDEGLRIGSNTGGIYTFNTIDITNTTTGTNSGEGLFILGNTNTQVNLDDVSILDVSGQGFSASSNNNTIVDVNTALDIVNTLIGLQVNSNFSGGNYTFDNVKIDNAGLVGTNIIGNRSDITFNGFDLNKSSGKGISLQTNSEGTVTFNNTTLDDISQLALQLFANQGKVVFNNLDIDNAAKGIEINGNTDDNAMQPFDFTFTNTNITNVDQFGVNVLNNIDNGLLTFDGLKIAQVTGVTGPGDAFMATGNIIVANITDFIALDAQGANLYLDKNTGSVFTIDGVDIDNSLGAVTGPGILALNGGTLNIINNNASFNNSINTQGAPALDLQNIDVGNSGITFFDINTNGGPGGIFIQNVGGDPTVGIKVTGDGTNAGSGGTITNTTGPAIVTENVQVPISLNFMTLDNNPNGALFLKNSSDLSINDSIFGGLTAPMVIPIAAVFDSPTTQPQILTLNNNSFTGFMGDNPIIDAISSMGANANLVVMNSQFMNNDLANSGSQTFPVIHSVADLGATMKTDIVNNTFTGDTGSNGQISNNLSNFIVLNAFGSGTNHQLGILGNSFSDSFNPLPTSPILISGSGGVNFEGTIGQNTFSNILYGPAINIDLNTLSGFVDSINKLDIIENKFDNIPNDSPIDIQLGENVGNSTIAIIKNEIGLIDPNVGLYNPFGSSDGVIRYDAQGPLSTGNPTYHTLIIDNNNIIRSSEGPLVEITTSGAINANVEVTNNTLNPLFFYNSPGVYIENGINAMMPLILSGNMLTPPPMGTSPHYVIDDDNGGFIILDPIFSTGRTPEEIIADNNYLPMTGPQDVLYIGGFANVPVVFDLDGDGIELIAPQDSTVINPQLLVNMGWVSADDGLLVYDQDADGAYSGLHEITLASYHPDAVTDLDGLRLAFDSNQDFVFDAHDELYDSFALWQDSNQNGQSDPGEFHYLNETSIASLDLHYDYHPTLLDGNIDFGSSTYTLEDGSVADLGNIGLLNAPFPSQSLSDLLGNCVECPQGIEEHEPEVTVQVTMHDPLLDDHSQNIYQDLDL